MPSLLPTLSTEQADAADGELGTALLPPIVVADGAAVDGEQVASSEDVSPDEPKSQPRRRQRLYTPRRQKTIQPLEAANVPEALLTLETVAALCGMCIRSIERRQRAGELGDLVRLAPNVVRLRSRNVVAWLASQTAAPMPASHRPPGRPGEPISSTTPPSSGQKVSPP